MNRVWASAGLFAALLVAFPAASQQGFRVPESRQRPGESAGASARVPLLPARVPDRARPPGRQPTQRMAPEERRKLRQDIHQHGRELYRGRGDQGRQ